MGEYVRLHKRWLKLIIWIAGLVSWPALSQTYEMDFPVKLNNVEVAQILASVNGFELASIRADEVHSKLGKSLSQSVNLWLSELGDKQVTIQEFAAKGITLKLNGQDFLIEMALAESAMVTDRLTWGRGAAVTEATGAAKWSLLNNLNLRHQRNNNNQNYDSQMEWLFYGNVGGGEGVNFNGSVFWEKDSGFESKTYRGDLQFFYDEPDKPRRYVFGDTQSRVTGHLTGNPIGGISIAKAYAQLQPQRNITPGNSQVFVLPRPATVEVLVNDFLVSKIRLRPGRYDINDLPLASGSNNVSIVALYANGETQEFDFTTHYNAQLLAEGISDYSMAFGLPSSIDNNVYHYDGDPVFSGMYEYGLTSELTVGVNGAARKDGQVAGVTATTGKWWGNVSMRYSMSSGETKTGRAFSLESEHSVLGQSQYGSPNLRLGYEKRFRFTASPWFANSFANTTERYFIDYSYYISDTLDFNLNGSQQTGSQGDKNKDFTAQLSWRHQGFNVSLGYKYDTSRVIPGQDQNRLFVNFSWSFYDYASATRSRVRYNHQTEVATASYTKINTNYLNEYGYEVSAEKGKDYRRDQFRGSYTHRLFRTDVTADNFTRSNQTDNAGVSVNLSTSVGVADGHVGMGSNITAPFAIVSKHKTLKDTEVLVNVNRHNRPQTKSGNQLGALLSLGTGYTNAQFNIDVPDAPLGYDWGPGTYRLSGGANTGHHFLVGSDLSYTIMGVMVDSEGKPLSLQRGKVILISGVDSALSDAEDKNRQGQPAVKSYAFFTNRAGRFVIEGIGAGVYEVQWQDNRGQFEIEASEERFINMGKLNLSTVGGD